MTLCKKMKPEHARRLIGGLAMLLGLWWTWNTVVSPFRKISTEGFDTSNIIFLLTIVPLMAIPGVIAIIFGARLFREFGELSLKWVIGVFAVFLAFFLAFKISRQGKDKIRLVAIPSPPLLLRAWV